MTKVVLAVDLGGTKVFTQLADLAGRVVFEQRFDSANFASFDGLLTAFFKKIADKSYRIEASCLAVAGPVVGQRADLTNLPWLVDAEALSRDFDLGQITLCNDFVAVGYGIDAVGADDQIELQVAEFDSDAPRVVIGAGTGLGQALVLNTASGMHVVATEGGNVDFGPRDDEQMALLNYLMPKMGHVSYERLLSGPGLEAMYQFYLMQNEQVGAEITASEISRRAAEGSDASAVKALQLFMRIYGAQAGNLALNTIARGGVFIAGGIAAKNLPFILAADFISAFCDKGKMAELMPLMPVTLITDEKVGLSGARYLALQSTL